MPPEFIKYFRSLCHQAGSTSRAINTLFRAWKADERIPGYEHRVNQFNYPDGWSERNLRRIAPAPAKLHRKKSTRENSNI